jgi:predicted transport protein
MDQAEKTMMDNLYKNTGKTLEQWIDIVKGQNFAKHGEIIKYLKDNHSFTHGFANMVAMKARGADAGSFENKDELIDKQYKGKEHFLSLYNNLLAEILKFGNDIEVAPKTAYVSLRRKKQFSILQPATKTRFEVGINLKGQTPEGRLEEIKTPNAMCSHKINLSGEGDVDKEVINWLRQAYDNAG